MKKINLSLTIILVLISCSKTKLHQSLIEEENLHEYIKEISSDKFQGRAPGTEGGELTKEYLRNKLLEFSLSPIDKNFLLEVPLVELEMNQDSRVSILLENKDLELTQGKEIVYWSKKLTSNIKLSERELVFVGYGIVAPEYNWNDYKNINMKGKIAVVLINDPGFATKNSFLFNGNSMTYYGRWQYKYEEAARQGAEGVLIIHETKPAAYPWQVVETSWMGKQISLDRRNIIQKNVKLEAWITFKFAKELFKFSGLNLESLSKEAISTEFQPVSMKNISLSANLINNYKFLKSHNVAAIKQGSLHPNEYILMMAHWDHLGIKDLGVDKIYNGAIDNATGVAGVLELAKTFSQIETDRSLLFLFVTAEESGLLGSKYFAEEPPISLSNIVAGFNFDAIHPIGKVKDVVVVGHGSSELEDLLKSKITKYGKYIKPDPFPEKGYFYRSDHISLAKKGVPVLYANGGLDKVDGGEVEGERIANKYTKNNYHQPSDEYNKDWDLSGFVEHLEITKEMVLDLANSTSWPNWYEGNEFKSIRDQSRKEK